MEKTAIEHLIKGYINDSLTAGEQQVFFGEVIKEENKALFQEIAGAVLDDHPELEPFDEKLWTIFDEVVKLDMPVKRVRQKFRWLVAAALIALLGIPVFLLVKNSNPKKESVTAAAADIQPGKEGAILTLSNGKQIVLDSLKDEVISTETGANIFVKEGRLTYSPSNGTTGEVVYNTVSTPKGRQFHIILPDGTAVWLNSASSISYPIIFAGNQRDLEITGEAYFEVTANNKKPFRVTAKNKIKVEVLGTHFNINAYDNEPDIQTTLLTGKVRVTTVNGDSASLVLMPGQQAQITVKKPGEVQLVSHPDLEEVMAWRNGVFHFDGLGLPEIMRQIERWYDIEVIYENGIPGIQFEGEMSKELPLSGLLLMLKKSGMHFTMVERKLIVQP
jgi:hypothetical protein